MPNVENPSPLRWSDYGWLVLYCLLLFGSVLASGRVLSGHEAVVPQGAREMLGHHDWLVPTCGGLPWLERPPLPYWIVGGSIAFFGSCADWVVRLPSVLFGCGIVCLAAWLTSICYGRGLGFLTGMILATMWEFTQYASNPEADIFLCAIVTGAIAVFAKQEFGPGGRDERRGFWGSRPWPVLAFFVLLGLTNLVKGLIFGTLMVVVPVGTYLLLRFDWQALRRYVWFWGWLAFAICWLAYPLAIYQRFPDVVAVWQSDYMGRLNEGYMGEPPWHYLVVLPWVIAPWTVFALIGLAGTGRQALREPASPERFLWCWSLATMAFFSIPQGKHHHYLLQSLAAWAVLAALGAARFWQSLPQWPSWLRLGLVGPDGKRPQVGVVLGIVFGSLLVLHGFANHYRAERSNYREEMVFLRQIEAQVPAGQPVYIPFDGRGMLETFRLLFYCREPVAPLHNLTYLLDERIQQPEVYVLARYGDHRQLECYGQWEAMLISESQRAVASANDRRTLFRLRFDEGLQRYPANLRVSPLQGTHRAWGPFLGQP